MSHAAGCTERAMIEAMEERRGEEGRGREERGGEEKRVSWDCIVAGLLRQEGMVAFFEL